MSHQSANEHWPLLKNSYVLHFYIFTQIANIFQSSILDFFLHLFSTQFKRNSTPAFFQGVFKGLIMGLFKHTTRSIIGIHIKTLYSTYHIYYSTIWTNSLCRRAGFLCVSATLWSLCGTCRNMKGRQMWESRRRMLLQPALTGVYSTAQHGPSLTVAGKTSTTELRRSGGWNG